MLIVNFLRYSVVYSSYIVSTQSSLKNSIRNFPAIPTSTHVCDLVKRIALLYITVARKTIQYFYSFLTDIHRRINSLNEHVYHVILMHTLFDFSALLLPFSILN